MTSKTCLRCGAVFKGKGGYCPAHKEQLDRTRNLARTQRATLADRIRGGQLWKDARASTLERDEHRCTFGLYLGDERMPGDGRCPEARRSKLSVHHITALEDGGEPYADDNLRTLCVTHHNRIEAGHRAERGAT